MEVHLLFTATKYRRTIKDLFLAGLGEIVSRAKPTID